MKKLLFGLIAVLAVSATTSPEATARAAALKTSKNERAALRTIKINATVTTLNGCNVRISGTLDYSIIPPGINCFDGTVTISGGDCKSQTLKFGCGGGANLVGIPSSDTPCNVTKVVWVGLTDADVMGLLNSNAVNAALAQAFQAACN